MPGDDARLADWGNRVPNLKIEVVTKGAQAAFDSAFVAKSTWLVDHMPSSGSTPRNFGHSTDKFGNFVLNPLGVGDRAVAEAERERICDVKEDQRTRRRYRGGIVPFGWRLGDDGALIEVPEQQAAIRRMVEMRRTGSSLRAIADAMKAEGFELSHVSAKKVIALEEDRHKQKAA